MSAQTASRLQALDILRLVSALMVMFYHYGFRMAMTGEGGQVVFPELLPWLMWGDTGVLVFFAISGYVIAMSADNRSTFDFSVNRLARLWPAFVVCATITALVLVLLPLPSLPRVTWAQWLAQFVFISRMFGQPFMDGVYWSIVYELVFYVWVAGLMAFGLYQRRFLTIMLVWLVISMLNEALLGSKLLRFGLLTDYSGYFAFGMLLYKSEERLDRRIIGLFVLAMAHILLCRFQFEPYIVQAYGFVRDAGGVALSGPLAMAAVVIAVSVRSVPLLGRYAAAMGALTYPLYLLHQNIGYAVFNRFGTMQNRWLLGLSIVGLLLALSWRISTQVEPVARRTIVTVANRGRDMVLRLAARRERVVPAE